MPSIRVIGDIHGEYEALIRLLRDADLISSDLAWTGRSSQLWFLGDFFDRGPHGLHVVDLVMRLQAEAANTGGRVEALLGNHDAAILSARLLRGQPTTGPGGTFARDWEIVGGIAADLAGLSDRHVVWLMRRPAMARVGDRLLVHADALFYTRYGRSVAEVNRNIRALLQNRDVAAWDRLFEDFSERNAFTGSGAEGAERAREFLRLFGGRQLIHGHTPIPLVTGALPQEVRNALVYAGGRCVNVDGGLFLGGPGFVHPLLPLASDGRWHAG